MQNFYIFVIMLKVKDWLKTRTNPYQFEATVVSGSNVILEAKRIKDGEIFDIFKDLGSYAFQDNEMNFRQSARIISFWEDLIHVTIDINIYKNKEIKIATSEYYLEINEIDIRKLLEIHLEAKKDFCS